MAQDPNQRRASDAVARWMSANYRNNSWLAELSGADPGTIGDFLNGKRWPKLSTMGRIERALGWPVGALRQIANGADPDSVGAGMHTGSYVASPGPATAEGAISNEDLYAILLRLREDVDRLSRRLDDLEEHGS